MSILFGPRFTTDGTELLGDSDSDSDQATDEVVEQSVAMPKLSPATPPEEEEEEEEKAEDEDLTWIRSALDGDNTVALWVNEAANRHGTFERGNVKSVTNDMAMLDDGSTFVFVPRGYRGKLTYVTSLDGETEGYEYAELRGSPSGFRRVYYC